MAYRPSKWPRVAAAVLLPPVILLAIIVGSILFVSSSVP
jgi:hypothetical protein